jgi:hypothetical protein
MRLELNNLLVKLFLFFFEKLNVLAVGILCFLKCFLEAFPEFILKLYHSAFESLVLLGLILEHD